MGHKQGRANSKLNVVQASWFVRLLRDQRAVSAVEYGLLLVAILLLVAGGYRLLGKKDSNSTAVAEATIRGNAEYTPPPGGGSVPGSGGGERGTGGDTPGSSATGSPEGVVCDGRSCGPGEGSCFVAGTTVATPSGDRPIESLHAGDLVLARRAFGEDVEARPVLRTFVRPAPSLVDVHTITVDDARDRVRSTPEHPYFTLDRGWTVASELVAGEALVDRTGHEVQVTKVVAIAQEAAVYNFEVDVDHSYFVGHTGLWVHNTCTPPAFQDIPAPTGTTGTDAVKAEKTAVDAAEKAAADAKRKAEQAKNTQQSYENAKTRRENEMAASADGKTSKIPESAIENQKKKADQKANEAAAAQADADAKKAAAEALAPAAEAQHIHDTLNRIPKPAGTGATDWTANPPSDPKLALKWGTDYGNNGENLPDPSHVPNGTPSPYKEYRVEPGGSDTSFGPAGNRRIVIDTRNGDAYYTSTHYGAHGSPAFVKIRNGWPP